MQPLTSLQSPASPSATSRFTFSIKPRQTHYQTDFLTPSHSLSHRCSSLSLAIALSSTFCAKFESVRANARLTCWTGSLSLPNWYWYWCSSAGAGARTYGYASAALCTPSLPPSDAATISPALPPVGIFSQSMYVPTKGTMSTVVSTVLAFDVARLPMVPTVLFEFAAVFFEANRELGPLLLSLSVL